MGGAFRPCDYEHSCASFIAGRLSGMASAASPDAIALVHSSCSSTSGAYSRMVRRFPFGRARSTFWR